jgi:hypothetical protein
MIIGRLLLFGPCLSPRRMVAGDGCQVCAGLAARRRPASLTLIISARMSPEGSPHGKTLPPHSPQRRSGASGTEPALRLVFTRKLF